MPETVKNMAEKKATSEDQDRINLVLHLADNSLIMGHRLSEWAGHGPMLEQDIAITNIALDLIGQSRNFYQYAAAIITEKNIAGDKVSEDTLAYLRDARDFKNLLITEIPNGDWGKTILKLFFFSAYQYFLYQKLMSSPDSQIAGISEKSLKEVTYHLRWSSEWVVRLGDGTNESKKRMKEATDATWPYTGEMFEPAIYEDKYIAAQTNSNQDNLKNDWDNKVKEVFHKATLPLPEKESTWMQKGGKTGMHTEHLGYILAEMQFLQRAYPGCDW